MFRRDDLRRRNIRGSDRPELAYDADEDIAVTEFSVRAESLRDRLDVLGLGMDAVRAAFQEIGAMTQERPSHWGSTTPMPPELERHWSEEAKAVAGLTVDSWIEEVRVRVAAGESTGARGLEVGTLTWLLGLWDDVVEPRVLLRLMAETFPEGAFVLDVSDLAEEGWLEGEVDPRQEALDAFGWILANGSPVVILTEGSTDAVALQAGLRVLRPHLVDFLRFPDFSVGAEGGAPALVRLLKSLWAAGIANRVVAIFDNDTASHEALRALDGAHLPHNLTYITLPPLEFAASYPTVGPAGPAEMDVNGLAASLELYLGSDVLTDELGALMPVQWTGYSRPLRRYQGELLDKRAVQERFLAKARRAEARGEPATGEDWTGLARVFDTIVAVLRRDSIAEASPRDGAQVVE